MASSPAHPREQHVGVTDFTKPIRNISIPFAITSSTTTAQSSHSCSLTFSGCHQRNNPCISISGSCSCIAVHNDNSVADNIADTNVLIRNVSNYDAVHVFDENCCVASNTDGLGELMQSYKTATVTTSQPSDASSNSASRPSAHPQRRPSSRPSSIRRFALFGCRMKLVIN